MNDGFRVTIDRRGSRFYWSFNLRGEKYESQRGEPSITEAADAADTYRRQLELGCHFQREKIKRAADRA